MLLHVQRKKYDGLCNENYLLDDPFFFGGGGVGGLLCKHTEFLVISGPLHSVHKCKIPGTSTEYSPYKDGILAYQSSVLNLVGLFDYIFCLLRSISFMAIIIKCQCCL